MEVCKGVGTRSVIWQCGGLIWLCIGMSFVVCLLNNIRFSSSIQIALDQGILPTSASIILALLKFVKALVGVSSLGMVQKAIVVVAGSIPLSVTLELV